VIESYEISDLLLRLVDRSLVSYDEETGRYSLLETVRQFAAEHQVNQEDSVRLRDLHVRQYLDLAEGARRKVRGAHQIEWLARYDAEYDNIRLAMEWASSQPASVDKAVLLAYRLADYWMIRSSFQESHAWLDRISSVRPLTDAEKCRIEVVRSSIGYFTGLPRPDDVLSNIELARTTNDEELLGDALGTAILDLLVAGRLEHAIAIREETLNALAKVDDHVMTGFVHINFGNNAFLRGDPNDALYHYLECLRVRRAAKDMRGTGAALVSIGYVKEALGQLTESESNYRRGISAYATISSPWDIGGGISCMGLELSRKGRMADVARILGFGDTLLRKVSAHRDAVDTVQYDHWTREAKREFGEGDFAALRKEGARMSLSQVIELLFPNGLEVPSFDDSDSSISDE